MESAKRVRSDRSRMSLNVVCGGAELDQDKFEGGNRLRRHRSH